MYEPKVVIRKYFCNCKEGRFMGKSSQAINLILNLLTLPKPLPAGREGWR
jgi:hypothetical protein